MLATPEGEHDARRSVLLAIRDQALRLKGPRQEPVEQWTQQQWWQGFNYLFVQSASSAGDAYSDGHSGGSDDLLFFVASDAATVPPERAYSVRRRANQLPPDLQLSGAGFDHVDWAQSVLLNLVLHSQYSLTVVACGREALPFVAEGRTWAPGMRAVTKAVYASPTILAVNLDSSRAGDAMPVPCFPDICFAVDNFANAFDDMVLHELDDCYCVVLHALLDAAGPTGTPPAGALPAHTQDTLAALGMRHGAAPGAGSAAAASARRDPSSTASVPLCERQREDGAAASSTQPDARGNPPSTSAWHSAASAGSSPTTCHAADGAPTTPPGWQIGTRKRTLFAGYVAFSQILDFMDANQRGLNAVFAAAARGGGGGSAHTDKLVMTGPAGTGRAEVAVTKLARQRPADAPQTPGGGAPGRPELAAGDAASARGAGALLQRGFLRAVQLATGLQKAMSEVNSDEPRCSMQCALMLLRLPVGHLAQELLEAV